MARLGYYGQPGSPQGTVSGPKGDPGTPGAIGVLYGSGAPSDAFGANGQGYVNEANGDLYAKVSGHWALQIPLKGPKGDDGDPGDPGVGLIGLLFGEGDPLPDQASDGQGWLNITTSTLFFKQDG